MVSDGEGESFLSPVSGTRGAVLPCWVLKLWCPFFLVYVVCCSCEAGFGAKAEIVAYGLPLACLRCLAGG